MTVPDINGLSTSLPSRQVVMLWSVRSLLLMLVLTCLIPGFIGVGFLIHRMYQNGLMQIRTDTIRTARAMMQAVDGELCKARVVAVALSTSNLLAASDLGGFHRRARELIEAEGIGVDVVLERCQRSADRQYLDSFR